MIIARALPVAIDVVSVANSSNHGAGTCRLSDHQGEIRTLFQEVQTIYAIAEVNDRYDWRRLQRPILEIYLRRILLMIHQVGIPPSSEALGKTHAQQEFLGSALAILVHQRQILEAIECPAMKMLAGLHKQDFFIAAIGACATLRNSQHGIEGDGLGMSTRQTIRDALHWCKELWARDVNSSTCNYWAYLILQRLLDAL